MNEKQIDGFARRDRSITKGTDPEKTFDFPFMTDAPCKNWWGPPESCLCREENVDLTRFNNGVMPVLFNHDRDKVIGRVDSIDFSKDGQVRASVTLGGSDDAAKVIKAIAFGSVKGISVGYQRLNTVDIPKGAAYKGVTYDEETYVTDRWMPSEISIVSCPADPECGIGRGFNNGATQKIAVQFFSGGKRMKEDKQQTATPAAQTPAPAPAPKVDDTAIQDAANRAMQAEHERTMSIISLCDQFSIGKAEREAMLSDTKVTLSDARRQVLDILAKRTQPTANVGGDMHVGEDDKEKFVKKAADGLCIQYRTLQKGEKPVDGANEYATCSLRALAEECLTNYGEMSASHVRHMTSSQMFEELFAKRAMGSEQFASVIDNFGNKTMLKAYTEHPAVFTALVSRGSNPDFKPTRKYRIGVDNEPELMAPESDEFKYGEMGDEYISTSIHTYGKAIGFTREIFINDDMGTVVSAIRKQSGGFRRAQERMFFEMLQNSVPFDKKHANLGTVGAISIEGYNEVRNLMNHQKDSEGKTFVGVLPRYILASDLYANEHATILHSTANPEQQNPGVINPMQDSMVLVTSPYVDGKTYYAIADPAMMEGIEFTTLTGSESPSSRTVVPGGHLGIDYQFWMDWGFNLIDYRAFAKQTVADK